MLAHNLARRRLADSARSLWFPVSSFPSPSLSSTSSLSSRIRSSYHQWAVHLRSMILLQPPSHRLLMKPLLKKRNGRGGKRRRGRWTMKSMRLFGWRELPRGGRGGLLRSCFWVRARAVSLRLYIFLWTYLMYHFSS